MFGKTEKKETVKENKDIQATKDTQERQLFAFDDMDKMFDQFLTNRWPWPYPSTFSEGKGSPLRSELRVPSVDIVEKNSNIIVRAEIPGVDKNDIEVNLNGRNLTIQAKNKKESIEDTEEYHHCEISTSSFSRTLTLPAEVDSSNVKATFKNGLLEVTMCKSEEVNQSKITIE